MDFDKYRIRLNLKSMCLFETLAGKSFYSYTEDDLLMVMYASLVANNDDMRITFEVFEELLKDKKVAKWMSREYLSITQFQAQFNKRDETTKGNEGGEPITAKDIASILIVNGHLDPHYVYYEMELWEIPGYLKTMDTAKKEALSEQRLWTYLTIMPHIDSKKIKSPDKLLPFPWEENAKIAGTKENLIAEKENIKAFFAQFNKKANEETDEQHNDIRPTELPQAPENTEPTDITSEGCSDTEGNVRRIGSDSETRQTESCIKE